MILILDFTRRCNSRCKSCLIWATKDPVTLPLPYTAKLFSQLNLDGVFVTGGEPYIHPQITHIARLLKEYHPHASWEAATNCISRKTEVNLAAIRDMGIRVTACLSLEGNEAQHDKARGVNGNYRRVMEVSAFCEAEGIPRYFSTVTDEGKAEGDRLGIMTAQKLPRFGERFGGTKGTDPQQVIPNCPGGTSIVCCDPYGKLWACEDYRDELYIGDITTQNVDDMRWGEVARYVHSGACGPCSMSCWYT